jgi:hypothetical protein
MVAAPGSIGMCLSVKIYVAHCVCSLSVPLLFVFSHALISLPMGVFESMVHDGRFV